MGFGDRDRRRRYLATGLDLMRAARPPRGAGGVVRLQMLYARGLTMAILPRPPVAPSEASRAMAALLQHPGFDHLHPLRRAQALAAKATVFAESGRASRQ